MASESLKDIVEFAVNDSGSQIRVENERRRLGDYQSGARHLNDILVEWGAYNCLVPGFHRKAFTIPSTKSVFTLGVGADLVTGAEVTQVNAILYRTSGGFQRVLERVNTDEVFPTGYERTNFFYGTGTNIYAVSFDGDFVRLVFPCELVQGDVLVIDYKSELGRIDYNSLTLDDIGTILVSLPALHLLALRYGVASKMATQYGSPMAQSLMRQYKHHANLILQKNIQPHFQKYDEAVLKTGRLYLRDGNTPITEIGGLHQSDGSIIIQEDHPNHPDFTDGTLHFGTISDQGADTQQGTGVVFRYGVLADVIFDPAPVGTQYLYMEAPQGSEITSIVDERQLEVLRAWNRQGQQWRLGPLAPASIGRGRRYKVIVRGNE